MAETGQIVETRQVGEQERLFHYLHTAGGLIASNYMYSVAARDGREIAALSREAPALSRRHPYLDEVQL